MYKHLTCIEEMLVDVVCLVEAVVGEAVFDPAKEIISSL